MNPSTSFRPDPESDAALRYLQVECGMSRSEAIRSALIELAERRRRAALTAEVASLARDPADRKEKAALTRLMDSLAVFDEGPG